MGWFVYVENSKEKRYELSGKCVILSVMIICGNGS